MSDASKTLTLILNSQVQGAMAGLNSTKSALGTLASEARGLILPASFAAGAFMAKRALEGFIDEMDRTNDGAKRLSMPVEEYQRLAYAAKHAGASAEALEPAFQRMNATIYGADEEGKKAQNTLDKLGLSLKYLQTLSQEQRFAAIAKQLGKITDASERAGLAQQVFGRGSVALMPLINDYENLHGELDRIDGVISGETIKAAKELNDAFLNISTSIKGMVGRSGLIEWLLKITESFEDIAKANALLEKNKKINKADTGEYTKHPGTFNDLIMELPGSTRPAEGEMIRTAPTRDEDVLAAQRAKRAKAEADKKAAEENARGIEERQKSLWVDELSGMRNKLEAQNLINAGKEKEAFIEGELVKLRKDHGGDLSFSQTSEAVGLAGKLFDAGTEKDKAGERKKLADMLADMKLKLDLQTKINAGKEKEAFITEELARLKPDNRDLTSGEAAQISGMAGQLYDAKAKAPRDEKTGERMDVDRLTKLGLYNFNFGGMRDTKSLDIERNSLLKRIAEKVGIPVERTMLQ